MADFGEYLPYTEDVSFFDGADGAEWHNKFSERWANLNMQVCYPFVLTRDTLEILSKGTRSIFALALNSFF